MNLTNKQKSLLPFLFLFIAFFGLIFPLQQAAAMQQVDPSTQVFKSRVKKPANVNTGFIGQKNSTANAQASTSNNKTRDLRAAFTKRQEEYLELANSYKISKMKRLIAEENEAIAIAQQHAAKAAVETQSMLTQAKDNNHVEVTALDMDKTDGEYKLIYTGEQAGRWNATIKYRGHLEDIVIGTILPNEAKVVSINRDMVVLQQGMHKKVVTFFNTTDTLVKPTANKIVKTDEPKTIAKVTTVKVEPPKETVQVAEKTIIVKPKLVAAKTKAVISQQTKQLKPKLAKIVPHTTKVAPAKKPVRDVPHFTVVEKRLLHTKPQGYTIQLLANTRLSAIKTFIDKNHLQKNAKYYRTTIRGLPMYVVIYNQYPSSEAAMGAVRDLPIELQRYTPFVKSLKSVQSELKRIG